ncbi:MAG TPA: ABC transporter permease subunit [Anaerolineales bacterium]|nr:ABC transporter permease subunit [Anaerolineales bacterium]
MKKITTIIRKEWAEIFKNRMVLFTVAFLPLILTAIPIGILIGMRSEATGMANITADMPDQFNMFCPADLNAGDCFQVYLVSQFMLMFMLLPLSIPATIAAYSIVGEKTTRSLEPLLATPITTVELLIGKSLSAVIPAVLATYAAFGIFAVSAFFLIPNRTLLAAILDARWLIAVVVLGPLLALMAVNFSIMVSSRVNDPRVAEQISIVVIIPLMAVFLGQLGGLFVINRQLVIASVVVVFLCDLLLTYLAVRLFERENILTRWK